MILKLLSLTEELLGAKISLNGVSKKSEKLKWAIDEQWKTGISGISC